MSVLIGVDGGGTRMRAVIADADGSELGRGEATGAVLTVGRPEEAAAAVAAAVRDAAARAGRELPGAALWAGLAGAGHEQAVAAVRGLLERERLAERVHVGTDAAAAFHAAFPEGPGLLLVAGTGSILWGRAPGGGVGRIGGWGRELGDEGSGYALGAAALRAVVRCEDGRGAPTSLRDRVLGALRLSLAADLVPWAASAAKAEVAALAPLVIEEAERGDAVAEATLDAAARDLADHVGAALERLGPWPAPPSLVLWGGLIAEGGPFRRRVENALGAHAVQLRSGPLDPALGAVALARSTLRRSGSAGPA